MVSRVRGNTTGRIHHLLSNIELSYFYLLDWSEKVLDIREQYPILEVDAEIKIADKAGLHYPYDNVSGFPYILTSDFLITTSDGEMVRSIKPNKQLREPQVREKFEIERRYWKPKEIDWKLVTENEIDYQKSRNIEWFFQAGDLRETFEKPEAFEESLSYFEYVYLNTGQPVLELARDTERYFQVEAGYGLRMFQYLAISKKQPNIRGGKFMLEKNACIYCGSTQTSESDIIPDALTNARILNKNVCKTEHNNKFSDLFESEVIEALALITNKLDIKSHKGKNYAAYPAKVEIDGIEYSTKMVSEKDLFSGDKVLVSTDKKHKLGSLEKVKQMAKDPQQVSVVDINKTFINERIEIKLEIFFSEKMFRMISKIAYEWYCSKNNVNGFHEEFENIVQYITEGNGENPVTIVQNQELYNYYEKHVSFGSHSLFCFIDNNKVNVVVALFGIAMYRVLVADTVPAYCENNFMYIELRTDSLRKEMVRLSDKDAEKYFCEYFFNQMDYGDVYASGIKVKIAKSIPKIDVLLYPFVFDMVKCFRGIHDETNTPNKTINNILIDNIQEILQASSLHKKTIKRFVKEYFPEDHKEIRINPDSTNKRTAFLFYILFTIGKENIETIDDNLLQKIVKKSLNMGMENEFVITDAIEKKMRNEMLNTTGYSNLLEKGADVIKKWKD